MKDQQNKSLPMQNTTTFDINTIRNYLLNCGFKIEYQFLVHDFKHFLYNPDANIQAQLRNQFKDYVNRLATVSIENGKKFIVLRPEYQPISSNPSVQTSIQQQNPNNVNASFTGNNHQAGQQHSKQKQPPQQAPPQFPPPPLPKQRPRHVQNQTSIQAVQMHTQAPAHTQAQAQAHAHPYMHTQALSQQAHMQMQFQQQQQLAHQKHLHQSNVQPEITQRLINVGNESSSSNNRHDSQPPPRPPPRRRASTRSMASEPLPEPVQKLREIHDLTATTAGRVKEHASKLNSLASNADLRSIVPKKSPTAAKENSPLSHHYYINQGQTTNGQVVNGQANGNVSNLARSASASLHAPRYPRASLRFHHNHSHSATDSIDGHGTRTTTEDSDSGSLQPLDPLRKRWMLEACKCNYNGLVQLLRDDPRLAAFKDLTNGYTAMHWAAKFGNLDIVKLIAGTHGVSSNIKSHGGYTPLHLAYIFNREKCADLLLKSYRADPNVRDHMGKKPCHYLLPKNSLISCANSLLYNNNNDHSHQHNHNQNSSSLGLVNLVRNPLAVASGHHNYSSIGNNSLSFSISNNGSNGHHGNGSHNHINGGSLSSSSNHHSSSVRQSTLTSTPSFATRFRLKNLVTSTRSSSLSS